MTIPSAPQKPTFGERLSLAFVAFARALMRLLLLLMIGLLVGVLAYALYPWLEAQFILPVQENTRRIEELSTRQAASAAEATQSAIQWQAQLATLEANRAADAATLAALQAQLEAMQTALQTQKDSDEASLNAAIARLDALEAALAEWDTTARQITATLQANTALLQGLAATMESPKISLEALRNEIQLLKAMQLLTRARLFLGQNNFGLADQDIQAAHGLLLALRAATLSHQWAMLDAALVRLELASQNLPAAPSLAAEDLEMAWQLLLQGLPVSPAMTPMPPGLAGTPPPPSTPSDATMTPPPASTATPLPYPTP